MENAVHERCDRHHYIYAIIMQMYAYNRNL